MNTSQQTMMVLLPGCKTIIEMGCPLMTIMMLETVLISTHNCSKKKTSI